MTAQNEELRVGPRAHRMHNASGNARLRMKARSSINSNSVVFSRKSGSDFAAVLRIGFSTWGVAANRTGYTVKNRTRLNNEGALQRKVEREKNRTVLLWNYIQIPKLVEKMTG